MGPILWPIILSYLNDIKHHQAANHRVDVLRLKDVKMQGPEPDEAKGPIDPRWCVQHVRVGSEASLNLEI